MMLEEESEARVLFGSSEYGCKRYFKCTILVLQCLRQLVNRKVFRARILSPLTKMNRVVEVRPTGPKMGNGLLYQVLKCGGFVTWTSLHSVWQKFQAMKHGLVNKPRLDHMVVPFQISRSRVSTTTRASSTSPIARLSRSSHCTVGCPTSFSIFKSAPCY